MVTSRGGVDHMRVEQRVTIWEKLGAAEGLWAAALRHGAFDRWYALATLGVTALVFVLAVVDWYGTGALSVAMLWLSILWMAVTSGILTRAYLAPDPVLGTRGGVPSR